MSLIETALKKLQAARAADPLGHKPPQGDALRQPALREPAAGPPSPSLIPVPRKKKAAIEGPRHHVSQADLVRGGLLAPVDHSILVSDEFRKIKRPLITNAFSAQPGSTHSNVIMIASALPKAGKTFCTLNLAVSLSVERDVNVLLVDADVAKPHITREFGLSGSLGLIDLLLDESLDINDTLVRTDLNDIQVLPAGRSHPQATELLASERMSRIVDELANRYADRMILLDSPPLLITSEAQALAKQVGQITLVVEAGSTSHHQLSQALETLDGQRAVSILLNKSRNAGWGRSGDYLGEYAGYGYGSRAVAQSRPRMLTRSLGLLALLTAGSIAAAELDVSLSVGLIKTDNLTLAPVDPESATVLNFSPEVQVTQESKRMTADAAYRMDAYYYDERGEDEIHNAFDGSVAFGVVPDKFFFNLGASREQAIIDPESTLPIDNLAITSNRVDRDEYFFGPSLELPIGSTVQLNGDVQRTWVTYGETDLLASGDDYVGDHASLSVDNYRKGQGLAWAARYESDQTDYGGVFVPYDYRQASMELGFWARQGTRLYASAGLESAWDNPLDPSLEDDFWEVGFARDLGEKLTADFAFGERTFGKSARAELAYNFGRGSTTLTYNERPRTSANDRYVKGGLLEPEEPNDYLYRAGSSLRYISNLLQWRVDIDLERTTFLFAVFDETRTEQTDLDGTPIADESQSGGNFSVMHRFGRRTELYLRATRAESEFASGGQTELSSDAIGAGYRLGRRTLLALELERREQVSNLITDPQYEVELGSLVLTRTF